jgi:hypothetical protein
MSKIKEFVLESFIENLSEISKSTLSSYVKKVPDNATRTKFQAIAHTKRSIETGGDTAADHEMMADKLHRRYNNRVKGVSRAVDKLTKE